MMGSGPSPRLGRQINNGSKITNDAFGWLLQVYCQGPGYVSHGETVGRE
jgi:hypothetical protein